MARDQRFIQQKHLKMNIQYIKRTAVFIACRKCGGTGVQTIKEYHNQYREEDCYLCNATGRLISIEETDITQEINSLIEITQTSL